MRLLLAVALLCGSLNAEAQVPEFKLAGGPPIKNYLPPILSVPLQNWAVVQDQRGVLYFGNQAGVAQYDGVSWRIISIPNQTVVRSLAVSAEGRVYVGARGELGYLTVDASGRLCFKSLLSHIAETDRDFSDIWKIYTTTMGVFFQSFERLFLWTGQEMKVWRPEYSFHFSFIINDILFVLERRKGLMRLADHTLVLVPGSERFADDRIYAMLRYAPDGQKILIAARDQGMLLYDYDRELLTEFHSEVNKFLIEKRVYCGVEINNRHFALGTLDGGMVIIDKMGMAVEKIDESFGLQSNNVKYIYLAADRALWLALDHGISRVEWPSPMSIIDTKDLRLKGVLLDGLRHLNALYLSTTQGAYRFEKVGSREWIAQKIIPFISWSLLAYGDTVLAATDEGIYDISGSGSRPEDQLQPIGSGRRATYLLRSKRKSNLVYAALSDKLTMLRHGPSGWSEEGHIGGIREDIRSIAEGRDGYVWLTTANQEVLRFEISHDFQLTSQGVERFGQDHKLPADVGLIRVTGADQGVLFSSSKQGIYCFDSEKNNFMKIRFSPTFDSGVAHLVRATQDGNLWVLIDDRVKIASYRSGCEYSLRETRMPAFREAGNVYVEEDGVVWITLAERLVRFDTRLAEESVNAGSRTMVRRVRTLSEETGREVIFDGSHANDPDGIPILTQVEVPELRYKEHDLELEFAASSYGYEEDTRYQYLLEGYQQNWSDWTVQKSRIYTNLWEDTYRFRVRAKNAYDQIGPEASFEFRVASPWYRKWWSYLFYALFSAYGFLLIVRYRAHQLVEQKLESTVLQRTQDLQTKNRELKAKNELIRQAQAQLVQSEKMAAVGQLAAGVAHEMNNPINFVASGLPTLRRNLEGLIGLVSKEQHDYRFKRFQEGTAKLLEAIEDGTDRITETVNDLLTFSRIDQATLEKADLHEALDSTLNLLQHQTKGGIEVIRDYGNIRPIDCYISHINQVFMNLLVNAIQAIEGKGTITITSGQTGEDRVWITICDTGTGIAPDIQQKIYDPFFTTKAVGEGTGLGLWISYGIIEQHKGTIEVESEPGKGTKFTITLPVRHSSELD